MPEAMEAALERVEQAWTDPGPGGQYHFAQWEHLRTGWPTLHRAITDLILERRRSRG